MVLTYTDVVNIYTRDNHARTKINASRSYDCLGSTSIHDPAQRLKSLTSGLINVGDVLTITIADCRSLYIHVPQRPIIDRTGIDHVAERIRARFGYKYTRWRIIECVTVRRGLQENRFVPV